MKELGDIFCTDFLLSLYLKCSFNCIESFVIYVLLMYVAKDLLPVANKM